MCYSATASFVASAALLLIGAFTFRTGRRTNYVYLSLIPLLFATHQFFEGLVWLAVNGVVNATVGQAGAYAFLVIADMLWPGFFAFATFWSESAAWRRRRMQYFVWLGVIWAAVAGFVLLTSSVSYAAQGGHISYDFINPSPWFLLSVFAVYAGTGVIPLFLSSENHLKYLGMMLLVAGVVTLAVAARWLTSIWCFWAAILSIYIYYIVQQKR